MEQQITLIQVMTKVQLKAVVVLNNGAPVTMNIWIDSVYITYICSICND